MVSSSPHKNSQQTHSPQKQLTLAVQMKPHASFDNFYAYSNQCVLTLFQQFLEDDTETLALLVGAPGTGKTHLLNAALNQLEQNRIGARFYPLSELANLESDYDPEQFFEGVSDYPFVFLDDVDQWLPHPARERILFNLYNQFKMHGQKMILTSATVPRLMRLGLPDLTSRLNSGLLLTLNPLSDDEKVSLLQRWAMDRGFKLNAEIAAYILTRSERSVPDLMCVIERLDYASLTAKSRITLPFIKKTFGW